MPPVRRRPGGAAPRVRLAAGHRPAEHRQPCRLVRATVRRIAQFGEQSPDSRRTSAAARRIADGLRALTAHGKPAAVTEFGCAPYRGAAQVGGRADAVIEWDDRARPARFTHPVTRDEREQADYVRELLGLFEHSGIDAAFVYTFARYDLPHSDADDRDFDKASMGIVKVLPDGRTGTTYPGMPWEPKAAFHALADYGRSRTRH
jgi:hypothetical protein